MILSGGGTRRGPSSGHPGRVRRRDVWDRTESDSREAVMLKEFITQSLTSGEVHTVDALISRCKQNVLEVQESGGITNALRVRVMQSILSAKLDRTVQRRLISILDQKPAFTTGNMRKKEKEEFRGSLEEFITNTEREKLISVIMQHLNIQDSMAELAPPLYFSNVALPGFGATMRMKHIECRYALGNPQGRKTHKKIMAFGYNEEGAMIVYLDKMLFRRS